MFESPLGLVAAENSSSGGAAIFQLLFFGLIFVAMYFLLIRPQRRRSREAQELNRALAEGDQVQMASGLVGFITAFDKEDVAGDVAWVSIADVEIDKKPVDIQVRVMRSSIVKRIEVQGVPSTDADASDEK